LLSSAVFGWEVSRARSGSAGASAADFQAEWCECGFSGPEHVYERLKPEEGIHYSILGNSAKLMTHDFRSKQDMEVGVDTERAFMIVEFAGDNLYFSDHLAYQADN
jgi:hypothetical protein